MMIIYKSFQRNLDSLKTFIDTFSPIAIEKDSNQIEETSRLMRSTLEKLGIDTKLIEEEKDEGLADESEPKKLELTREQFAFLGSQLRKIPKISTAHAKILFQSSFVLLIGYFEYLFADLIKFYYKNYPGQIADKPINVLINELRTYDTIEEAVDYVINKEVEALLFDLSFQELTSYFNKNLKIDLEDSLLSWDEINEARERRHIIVHNNSVINKKYLSKSNIDNLPDKEKIILGEHIQVGGEYFKNIYSHIYTAGHLLIFNCWRQWVKNDSQNVVSEILNTSFDCLKQDLYVVAEKITCYSSKIDPKSDEEYDILLRCKINHCIALKQQDKENELVKELDKIKISVLSPIFKVAFYALKDDKENVLQQLKNCKIVDQFRNEWLKEWPLFKNLREDESFITEAEKILEP